MEHIHLLETWRDDTNAKYALLIMLNVPLIILSHIKGFLAISLIMKKD